MKNWYVYVLKGNNDRFYTGMTCDIDKRIKQHTLGQSSSTKNMGGFSLIHVEICQTRNEARKTERFLKNGYGREITIEIKINQQPEC